MSVLMSPKKRKPGAWLALLLFLAYALAPEITQTLGWLRDSPAHNDWPQLLCSAQGATPAPAHDGRHPARHSGPASCPFCVLQAHQPAVAHAALTPAPMAPARLPWASEVAYVTPPLEWGWQPAQPRAPPPSLG